MLDLFDVSLAKKEQSSSTRSQLIISYIINTFYMIAYPVITLLVIKYFLNILGGAVILFCLVSFIQCIRVRGAIVTNLNNFF